jgi:hypothetical protein
VHQRDGKKERQEAKSRQNLTYVQTYKRPNIPSNQHRFDPYNPYGYGAYQQSNSLQGESERKENPKSPQKVRFI